MYTRAVGVQSTEHTWCFGWSWVCSSSLGEIGFETTTEKASVNHHSVRHACKNFSWSDFMWVYVVGCKL